MLMSWIRHVTGATQKSFEPLDYSKLFDRPTKYWDGPFGPLGPLAKPIKRLTPTAWAEQRLTERGWVEISEVNRPVADGGGGYNLNDPRSPIRAAIKRLEEQGHTIERPLITKGRTHWVRYTLVKA
jgi:hypothetical protein